MTRPTPKSAAKGTQALASVTVRRKIEATPEELFDAWLDPDAAVEWMRPSGIDRTAATIDARVGGTYEITMHRGAGPLLHTGVYREIDRPRRLVFTWTSPATGPASSLVTVEFHARGRTATEVVIIHAQLPHEDLIPSHTAGWSQALDRLVDLMNHGGAESTDERTET